MSQRLTWKLYCPWKVPFLHFTKKLSHKMSQNDSLVIKNQPSNRMEVNFSG